AIGSHASPATCCWNEYVHGELLSPAYEKPLTSLTQGGSAIGTWLPSQCKLRYDMRELSVSSKMFSVQ
ncbi:MAG: hypothetical protein AAFX40_12130, partial [Cyanobacteria bacterium J06639_1]